MAGFGLKSEDKTDDAWSSSVKFVRKWVKHRIERNNLLNDAYWKG